MDYSSLIDYYLSLTEKFPKQEQQPQSKKKQTITYPVTEKLIPFTYNSKTKRWCELDVNDEVSNNLRATRRIKVVTYNILFDEYQSHLIHTNRFISFIIIIIIVVGKYDLRGIRRVFATIPLLILPASSNENARAFTKIIINRGGTTNGSHGDG